MACIILYCLCWKNNFIALILIITGIFDAHAQYELFEIKRAVKEN